MSKSNKKKAIIENAEEAEIINSSGENDAEDIESDSELKEEKTNGNAGRRVSKRKVSEDASVDEPIKKPKKVEKASGSKHNKKAAAAGRRAGKNSDEAAKVEEDIDEEDKEEEVEAEYEVKEIIDHKTQRGASYFLIRWKGYTAADDTWEPEVSLSCPELIAAYRAKHINGTKTAAAGKKKAAKKVEEEDPSKEWEISRIIDYAVEDKKRIFRIRWKGYSAKFDTWEPEENLSCDEMIKNFMKTQEAPQKELREEPKKTKRLVNETAPRKQYKLSSDRASKRAGSKKT